MSKLSDYLKKNKIDARRVVAASKSIEGLRPEDRAIRLARKQTKAGKEGVTDALKELAAKKMRSGHKVSRPAFNRALAGEKLTTRARGRIVRAVNAVLAHKSKAEAKAADLF
jgi:hypothetical protein